MIVSGGKLIEQCPLCGKYVQINKKFFGSAHFCLTEEEIGQLRAQRALAMQQQAYMDASKRKARQRRASNQDI